MKRFYQTYWAAYRHELQQLKTQASTYIFLSFAWLAMALLPFYVGGFFAEGRAELSTFFTFHPWVYMFLLPALAMGAWAEEWRRGTIERLLTLPVSPFVITLAKFKALQTVMLIALLGTFPMVLTVSWLGNPAWGPIITAYIGSFLLGSAMLAVALAASQLGRSQASAFVLGVLFLFTLLASGWGLLTRLLEGFLPQILLDILIRFSLLDRFRNFGEGIIDLRDIIFFVSLLIVFVFCTHLFLLVRRGKAKMLALSLPAIAVVFLVNSVAGMWLVRWDATPQKSHTMSGKSSVFINELEQDINLTLYYSADNRDVPIPVQHYFQRVTDKLRDMQEINPQRIHIQRIVPERDVDLEMQALKHGMEEVPLPSGEGYYFGLSMESGGRVVKIPFLTPLRQGFLEFDLMSGLTELSRTKMAKIGILTELDLGYEENRPQFMKDLLDVYDVDILQGGVPEFNENIAAIIVFITPFFDRESLYALDQYIVKGGKVLMVLDPFLRTAPDKTFNVPDRNADAWGFDHPADLLRHWGIEYDHRHVVADPALAMTVRLPGIGVTRYPMWLTLGVEQVNDDLPFTAHVQNILLAESGHFTQTEVGYYLNYDPIFTTSAKSQVISRTLLENNSSPQPLTDDFIGPEGKKDLAFMLSGRFESAFNGVTPVVKQYYIDYADDPEKLNIPSHAKETDKEGAIIVLGDLDFLSAEYALRRESVLGQTIMQPANDNLAFFYNVVQYLMGDRVLLPLRGKAVDVRPFIRVEEMLTDVSSRYQRMEQELVAELFQVAQRIHELEKRSGMQKQLQQERIGEIRAFQARELDVKKRLREVRRNLRKDVELLERLLVLFNMLCSPIIVWIYAIVLFTRRRKLALNGTK